MTELFTGNDYRLIAWAKKLDTLIYIERSGWVRYMLLVCTDQEQVQLYYGPRSEPVLKTIASALQDPRCSFEESKFSVGVSRRDALTFLALTKMDRPIITMPHRHYRTACEQDYKSWERSVFMRYGYVLVGAINEALKRDAYVVSRRELGYKWTGQDVLLSRNQVLRRIVLAVVGYEALLESLDHTVIDKQLVLRHPSYTDGILPAAMLYEALIELKDGLGDTQNTRLVRLIDGTTTEVYLKRVPPDCESVEAAKLWMAWQPSAGPWQPEVES